MLWVHPGFLLSYPSSPYRRPDFLPSFSSNVGPEHRQGWASAPPSHELGRYFSDLMQPLQHTSTFRLHLVHLLPCPPSFGELSNHSSFSICLSFSLALYLNRGSERFAVEQGTSSPRSWTANAGAVGEGKTWHGGRRFLRGQYPAPQADCAPFTSI